MITEDCPDHLDQLPSPEALGFQCWGGLDFGAGCSLVSLCGRRSSALVADWLGSANLTILVRPEGKVKHAQLCSVSRFNGIPFD